MVNCECGRTIRCESDDEVVGQAEEHIRESPPELVGTVSRAQLLGWVEEE